MVIARPGLTLEQFLALPEEEPALEYEDGVVTQKVSPTFHHGLLQAALVLLFSRAAAPRTVHVVPEVRFSAPRRSYVPDVSVYLWHRIAVGPDGRFENSLSAPPDVAVAIVSPEQSVSRLVEKCLWYVANSSKAALLIDPDDRTIFHFRPGGITQALRDDDTVDLSDVLSDLHLTPDALFAYLRPA